MNREREARRARRSLERESRRTSGTELRGRQRIYRGLATAGLVLLGFVGGGVGIYTYVQNQEVSTSQLVEVEKSQKEIDLWKSVDEEIKQNIEDKTFIPATKLNIVTGAMSESENPYFKDAVTFLTDQYNEGRIGTSIVPNLPDAQSLLESHLQIYEGRLGIGIAVNASVILPAHPLEVAVFIVHEMEHAKNAFETNKPLVNKSGQEQFEHQRRRILSRNEFVAEEARGYMAQAKAIMHTLGLMYSKDQHKVMADQIFKQSGYGMVESAIKSSGNPTDPNWRKFLRNSFSVQ